MRGAQPTESMKRGLPTLARSPRRETGAVETDSERYERERKESHDRHERERQEAHERHEQERRAARELREQHDEEQDDQP